MSHCIHYSMCSPQKNQCVRGANKCPRTAGHGMTLGTKCFKSSTGKPPPAAIPEMALGNRAEHHNLHSGLSMRGTLSYDSCGVQAGSVILTMHDPSLNYYINRARHYPMAVTNETTHSLLQMFGTAPANPHPLHHSA
jgi:hypothetical protein